MTEYPHQWTCEITLLRLEAYLLGTLPLGGSLSVAAHVEACPACFQLLMQRVEQRLAMGSAGSERSARAPHG